jgi:hypothetical protein
MRKILVYLIFCILCNSILAQAGSRDILHLKNAKLIKGIVFEQVPSEYLKIYTDKGDTLKFRNDEIRSISRAAVLHTGYESLVEMGAFVGEDQIKLKFNVINGYRFSQFFFGLGIGLRIPYFFTETYPYNNPIDLGIPIYLDFRTRRTFNKVCPYFELSLGLIKGVRSFEEKAVSLEDTSPNSETDGPLLGSSLGCVINLSEKGALNLGLNYELLVVNNNDYYSSEADTFYNISLMVGISFMPGKRRKS